MTHEQLCISLAQDLRNAMEDAAVRATQLAELGFHISARVEPVVRIGDVPDVYRAVTHIVEIHEELIT